MGPPPPAVPPFAVPASPAFAVPPLPPTLAVPLTPAFPLPPAELDEPEPVIAPVLESDPASCPFPLPGEPESEPLHAMPSTPVSPIVNQPNRRIFAKILQGAKTKKNGTHRKPVGAL